MLQPCFVKHRKMHLGNFSGVICKDNFLLTKNSLGLQAVNAGVIKSNQMESARKVISREIKKLGKIYIRIFPDRSISNRSRESRMGSGKGSVSDWVSIVIRNTVILEVTGVVFETAFAALKAASYKLPIRTVIINNY